MGIMQVACILSVALLIVLSSEALSYKSTSTALPSAWDGDQSSLHFESAGPDPSAVRKVQRPMADPSEAADVGVGLFSAAQAPTGVSSPQNQTSNSVCLPTLCNGPQNFTDAQGYLSHLIGTPKKENVFASYVADQSCSFTLRPPSGCFLEGNYTLDFEYFSVESATSCRYDTLEVLFPPKYSAKYCGCTNVQKYQDAPPNVMTFPINNTDQSHGSFSASFSSDGGTQWSGFRAKYSIVPRKLTCEATAACFKPMPAGTLLGNIVCPQSCSFKGRLPSLYPEQMIDPSKYTGNTQQPIVVTKVPSDAISLCQVAHSVFGKLPGTDGYIMGVELTSNSSFPVNVWLEQGQFASPKQDSEPAVSIDDISVGNGNGGYIYRSKMHTFPVNRFGNPDTTLKVVSFGGVTTDCVSQACSLDRALAMASSDKSRNFTIMMAPGGYFAPPTPGNRLGQGTWYNVSSDVIYIVAADPSVGQTYFKGKYGSGPLAIFGHADGTPRNLNITITNVGSKDVSSGCSGLLCMRSLAWNTNDKTFCSRRTGPPEMASSPLISGQIVIEGSVQENVQIENREFAAGIVNYVGRYSQRKGLVVEVRNSKIISMVAQSTYNAAGVVGILANNEPSSEDASIDAHSVLPLKVKIQGISVANSEFVIDSYCNGCTNSNSGSATSSIAFWPRITHYNFQLLNGTVTNSSVAARGAIKVLASLGMSIQQGSPDIRYSQSAQRPMVLVDSFVALNSKLKIASPASSTCCNSAAAALATYIQTAANSDFIVRNVQVLKHRTEARVQMGSAIAGIVSIRLGGGIANGAKFVITGIRGEDIEVLGDRQLANPEVPFTESMACGGGFVFYIEGTKSGIGFRMSDVNLSRTVSTQYAASGVSVNSGGITFKFAVATNMDISITGVAVEYAEASQFYSQLATHGIAGGAFAMYSGAEFVDSAVNISNFHTLKCSSDTHSYEIRFNTGGLMMYSPSLASGTIISITQSSFISHYGGWTPGLAIYLNDRSVVCSAVAALPLRVNLDRIRVYNSTLTSEGSSSGGLSLSLPDASIANLTNSQFSRNLGGLGGAMQVYVGYATFRNVSITNNFANYAGGAIYGTVSSGGHMILEDSIVDTNTGGSGGTGGIALFGQGPITPRVTISNSIFRNNSQGFKAAVQNIDVLGGDLESINSLFESSSGRVMRYTSSLGVPFVECEAGSVFQNDALSVYYQGAIFHQQSIKCLACVEGQYSVVKTSSVNPGQCFPCPGLSAGIKCLGSNRTMTLKGHFPYRTKAGQVMGIQCAPGVCFCTSNSNKDNTGDCDIDFNNLASVCVSQNRTGNLCGACLPGHSAGLGGTSCVENSRCNAASYFVPSLVLLSGAFFFTILYGHKPIELNPEERLVKSDRRFTTTLFNSLKTTMQGTKVFLPGTGWTRPLLHFCQVAPLVAPNTYLRNSLVHFIQSVGQFELQPTSGGSPICLWQGLSDVGVKSLNYIIPGALFCWWLAGIAISAKPILVFRQSGLRMLSSARKQQEKIQNLHGTLTTGKKTIGILSTKLKEIIGSTMILLSSRSDLQSALAGTAVALLSVLYSSLLETSLRLVTCVKLGNKNVLLISGDIECFTGWQIALMATVLPLLFTYPFLVVYIIKRLRKRMLSPLWASVLMSLQGAFESKVGWWEAVLLLRRLIFSLNNFIFSEQQIPIVASFIALIALLTNMIFKPFRDKLVQATETLCLSCLLVLCSISSVQQMVDVVMSAPNPALGAVDKQAVINPSTLQSWQDVVMLTPPLLTAMCFILQRIRRARQGRNSLESLVERMPTDDHNVGDVDIKQMIQQPSESKEAGKSSNSEMMEMVPLQL